MNEGGILHMYRVEIKRWSLAGKGAIKQRVTLLDMSDVCENWISLVLDVEGHY